ncbi:hypothetical protein O9992_07480 [Vibrio lentus]|nr:hypothetical protein [Vibrio lentus]
MTTQVDVATWYWHAGVITCNRTSFSQALKTRKQQTEDNTETAVFSFETDQKAADGQVPFYQTLARTDIDQDGW